jgi:uncharacterized membrane protein
MSSDKPSKQGGLLDQLPVERLVRESASLGVSMVESGLSKVGHGLGRVTDAPKAVAHAAKSGGESVAHAAKSGGETVVHAGQQVVGKLSNNESGSQKPTKVTNIVEEIDVPVPRSVAYDQWTRFEEFPAFTKKVEHVEQVSDERVTWQAKVMWSKRTWEAKIIEQIPDERIVWRSKGDKGHVDGAVTFHELTPDLTRITMVLEYHPGGLFEKTGNLWRAQGRRARLELKHFRRHVSTQLLEREREELEGWRGEIHDGHPKSPSKKGDQSSGSQRGSSTSKKSGSSAARKGPSTSRGTAEKSQGGHGSRKKAGSARKRAASKSSS